MLSTCTAISCCSHARASAVLDCHAEQSHSIEEAPSLRSAFGMVAPTTLNDHQSLSQSPLSRFLMKAAPNGPRRSLLER